MTDMPLTTAAAVGAAAVEVHIASEGWTDCRRQAVLAAGLDRRSIGPVASVDL